MDTGDYVIVVNADKIKVTGKKDGSEDLQTQFRMDWRIKRDYS